MVLDTSLLNTHDYKVRIEGKWNNAGKGVSPFPLHPGVVVIEKGTFGLFPTKVSQLT